MKVELQLETQGPCLKQENSMAAGQRGTYEDFQAAVRFDLSNLILAHHIDNKKKNRLGVKITYFGPPAQTRRIKDLQYKKQKNFFVSLQHVGS